MMKHRVSSAAAEVPIVISKHTSTFPTLSIDSHSGPQGAFPQPTPPAYRAIATVFDVTAQIRADAASSPSYTQRTNVYDNPFFNVEISIAILLVDSLIDLNGGRRTYLSRKHQLLTGPLGIQTTICFVAQKCLASTKNSSVVLRI